MPHYLTLLLIVCGVSSAGGQSTSSTNPLTGSVQDPSGGGVQGVKLTLKPSDGGNQQITMTDGAGAFRFEHATAGAYELRVEKEGFKMNTSRIKIGSRAPDPMKIVLSIADVRQQITVSTQAARVSTDTADNLDTVTLDRQALDNLPIFDQDYIGTMSRFLDSGAVGTGGVTLIVDGLEATRAGVSASAIQEVKLNQNPYSAEYSRPGRGRIEIITKPGSQEFHGTFNFLFRDYHLNAREPFAIIRPPEQRRIFEGSLTGPVGGSKNTSFLISANREEEDTQAIVFAIGAAGPIQENVATPQRNLELTASMTHQFGSNHLISIRGVYTDRTIQNQGVGGVTLPEAGANFEDREDLLFFALSENLTEWAYYVAFMIRRTARSSRLLADSRLALSSR